MTNLCEWCGHPHEREALCASRPTWGRRGFLALFGAGLAGLAMRPDLRGVVDAPPVLFEYPVGARLRDSGGNEYLYVEARAGWRAGELVSLDPDRRDAGRIGVAKGDVPRGGYGFAQVYGVTSENAVLTYPCYRAGQIVGIRGRVTMRCDTPQHLGVISGRSDG